MSPQAIAPATSLKELRRELLPGFDLQPDGKTHFKLVKDGEIVRRANGQPVTVPGTSTHPQTLRTARRTLVRVGAVQDKKQVPKRAQRQHRADKQLALERSEAELAGEQRVRDTDQLRQRLDPLLAKAGEVRATDLARVASYVHGQWTVDSAVTTAGFYLTGKALSDGEVSRLTPLVLRLEQADNPRAEWFMLLRETLGLDQPQLSGGEEWPFAVRLVPLEKIFSHYVEDGGYQRPLEENFVRDLTLRFDERLVGTIDVSERKNGSFAVIDGQQRSEAMRRVGKKACYASVYTGLDLAQEATLFFHKNKDRKVVHPFYEFMARVAARDPVALDVKRIVERAGFRLAIEGGAGIAKYAGERDRNITAVRAVEEVYGYATEVRAEALSPTLNVIFRNWFGRRDSLSLHLIKGLGRFFRIWGDEEIQWEHLEEQLSALGPTLVLGMGEDQHQTARRHMATRGIGVSLALVEIHNRGLARSQRLDPRLVKSWRQPPVATYRR